MKPESQYRTTVFPEPLDDRPTRAAWRYVGCMHLDYAMAGLSCTAFPKAIPEDIAHKRFAHVNPYPGDHGIQFVEITDEQIDAKELGIDVS